MARRRRKQRGLAGSEAVHAENCARYLRIAQRPVANGCSQAFRALGAAQAELEYVTEGRAALRRAFVEAGHHLAQTCTSPQRRPK